LGSSEENVGEIRSRKRTQRGVLGFPADPSIILLQNPEGSIWALQKDDASYRLPLLSPSQ
jgi:hypothetical protein